MPVAYRPDEPSAVGGSVGFLRIVSIDRMRTQGGLLIVNALGEPRSFTYNQVFVQHPFLWPFGDPARRALPDLIRSVFDMCIEAPDVIVFLTSEVSPDFFTSKLHVDGPVAGVPGDPESSFSGTASDLVWIPQAIQPDSRAMKLIDLLIRGDMLYEPFLRASIGLTEVYRTDTVDPE